MLDVTMCRNRHCPIRKKCFRYRAKPSQWYQSYSDYQPDSKGDCDGFWDCQEYVQKNLVPMKELEEWMDD